MNHIVDTGDLVALPDELGHDVAWGDLKYGDATAEQTKMFKDAYELLDGEFHTDGDLYQGSTLMRVIRRIGDRRLFGFAFWQGGGKYGEANIEANGDDHGFPGKYDWQDGVDEDEVWYVFRPIELAPLPAYKFIEAAK